MYEKFYSPNILAVASSLVGEDSLSVSLVILFRLIYFVLIFFLNFSSIFFVPINLHVDIKSITLIQQLECISLTDTPIMLLNSLNEFNRIVRRLLANL